MRQQIRLHEAYPGGRSIPHRWTSKDLEAAYQRWVLRRTSRYLNLPFKPRGCAVGLPRTWRQPTSGELLCSFW